MLSTCYQFNLNQLFCINSFQILTLPRATPDFTQTRLGYIRFYPSHTTPLPLDILTPLARGKEYQHRVPLAPNSLVERQARDRVRKQVSLGHRLNRVCLSVQFVQEQIRTE